LRRSSKWIIFAGVVGCALLGAASVSHAQAVAPKDNSVTIDGEYGPFLPTDISVDGYQVDRLINVLHVFMIGLFVGWGAFFVYCLLKFRQRTGHRPNNLMIKAKPSKYLEIAVAIFEAVLLFGFSIPVWARVKSEFPTDNPYRVRVVAEQFAWNFQYPGADGKFGKLNPANLNLATNPLGLVKENEGKDDFVSGEFHVPEGKPVIVEITSKDVIHSFFVPVLRVKQDAIPGMRIPIWFRTKEKSAGTYEVGCAQLCGNNHFSMRALMKVDTPEQYAAWVKKESAPPEEFNGD